MSTKKTGAKKPKSTRKGKVAIKRGTKHSAKAASEAKSRNRGRVKKGEELTARSAEVHDEITSDIAAPLPTPGVEPPQDADIEIEEGVAGNEGAGAQQIRLGAIDHRLPQVPTTLVRRDRHGVVQCECTVGPNGILYNGRTYRSLSGAASAASKDLGMNPVVNGFVFFHLAKPARGRVSDVERLQRIGKRYEEQLGAMLSGRSGEPPDEAVKNESAAHAERVVRILAVCAG
jgi:hypothetical protein